LEKDGNMDFAKTARFVAGHSLGEYSALTAAGALTLADAATLLKARGRAMQQAVPVGVGAMAALLGLDIGPVAEVVAAASAQSKNGEIISKVNDNADRQELVLDHVDAVEAAHGIP